MQLQHKGGRNAEVCFRRILCTESLDKENSTMRTKPHQRILAGLLALAMIFAAVMLPFVPNASAQSELPSCDSLPVHEPDPATYGDMTMDKEYQRVFVGKCRNSEGGVSLYGEISSTWYGKDPSPGRLEWETLSGRVMVKNTSDPNYDNPVINEEFSLQKNPRVERENGGDHSLYYRYFYVLPANGVSYTLHITGVVRQQDCNNGIGEAFDDVDGSMPAPATPTATATTPPTATSTPVLPPTSTPVPNPPVPTVPPTATATPIATEDECSPEPHGVCMALILRPPEVCKNMYIQVSSNLSGAKRYPLGVGPVFPSYDAGTTAIDEVFDFTIVGFEPTLVRYWQDEYQDVPARYYNLVDSDHWYKEVHLKGFVSADNTKMTQQASNPVIGNQITQIAFVEGQETFRGVDAQGNLCGIVIEQNYDPND